MALTWSPLPLQVSWRPPARAADRIDYYKLLMSTSTGEPALILRCDPVAHILLLVLGEQILAADWVVFSKYSASKRSPMRENVL